MSDKEQIEAAKAAYDKATPGEWKYCGCNRCQLVWGDGLLVHDQPDGGDEAPTPCDSTGINNAILIAAAPALMRRVLELEAVLQKIVVLRNEFASADDPSAKGFFHRAVDCATAALIIEAKE